MSQRQRSSGKRRDWSMTALQIVGILLVLSMVLSLFAPFLSR